MSTNERMNLLYKKHGRSLYGYVAFYRTRNIEGEVKSTLHAESNPFVIGRYLANGSGTLEVVGGLPFLLKEIRRSIRGFISDNRTWCTERFHLTSEAETAECDALYDKKAMDHIILISTRTRNLLDLVRRLDAKSIPRLDHCNSPDGEVKLRELFDTLIHNRYYFFDGSRVRDLFSDNSRKISALSGRFMGYAFDIKHFIGGVSEIIEKVTVKDLTQFLRGRIKKLTVNSDLRDVVSLIQNVHAFSDILQSKIPTAGYAFMMALLFDDLANSREMADSGMMLNGSNADVQKVIFETPHVGISGNLDEKEFEIRVRYAMGMDRDPSGGELENHIVRIGFEKFLIEANKAFGSDRILTEKSPRLVWASVD